MTDIFYRYELTNSYLLFYIKEFDVGPAWVWSYVTAQVKLHSTPFLFVILEE